MSSKKWWEKGIRFQCQQSGNCCVSRGQYGYVYMTLKDRKAMAQLLKLSTAAFTRKYCAKTEDHYHLKDSKNSDNCIFLEGHKCKVYKARPTQCRTWPFWPEHMGAKTWKNEITKFCPGVGKGPVIPKDVISEQLNRQIDADLDDI